MLMSAQGLTMLWLGACLLLMPPALGYKHFQTKIPNGDVVPDPSMDDNTMWQGVGHLNSQGGGARNVFGLDFKENGNEWSQALCRMDSDKDGLTNGEELGDPDCVWTPGEEPRMRSGLSHPGICEPLDKAECQDTNKVVRRSSGEQSDCPARREPDLKSTVFRLPPTQVPAEETSYYCQYFPIELPAGTSEHVVAYEPIIDNTEVMHHWIAYGCRAEESAMMANSSAAAGPVACTMGMATCQEILVLWTVGVIGMCHPEEYGGLIGNGGFTGIWLEHHWNNPLKKAGMMDSSGLTLYHTPNLRPNNVGFIMWGSTGLDLPPGTEGILQQGGCDPQCTQDFNSESIFISQIIPYMHYLGTALNVKLNGKLILAERDYRYNAPQSYTMDPPVEMRRGDHLTVNCTYDTTNTSSRTYFGLGSSDEMCFAVMLIYPFDQSIPNFCTDNNGVGFCPTSDVPYGEWEGCDMDTLDEGDWTSLYMALISTCDTSGVQCRPGCAEAIEEATGDWPCLRGNAASLVRSFLTRAKDKSIVHMLSSCLEVTYDMYCEGKGELCNGSRNSATLTSASLGLLLLALSSVLMQLC